MTEALIAMQAVISGVQDAIAESLIVGEQQVIETPKIQMSVGKVDGMDAVNSEHGVGGSTFTFPTDIALFRCLTMKVMFPDGRRCLDNVAIGF